MFPICRAVRAFQQWLAQQKLSLGVESKSAAAASDGADAKAATAAAADAKAGEAAKAAKSGAAAGDAGDAKAQQEAQTQAAQDWLLDLRRRSVYFAVLLKSRAAAEKLTTAQAWCFDSCSFGYR